jgi:hypothetical protein
MDEIYDIVVGSEAAEFVEQTYLEIMAEQFDIFSYNINNYYLAPATKERGMERYINTLLNALTEKLKEIPGNHSTALAHQVKQTINNLKNQED